MAKGLNQVQVGLTFTADTGQAKAQLQDLKNTINSLYSSTAKQSLISNLTPEVNEALTSVAKLKTALEQATNVDTGRLDLSKFSQQLQKGGISLKQYANHLIQLGPTGEKAFMQLAQSIVTAEVPMRRANAALTEMWTTLKNTARWQLSSSILHGFMEAVQSAYGYAQDLNESLNNIRIVTSQNIEQMARFADQANKAAKALSTTTTDYTNASLIYYQQGLTDSEVQQRTDITIKMANVARQSAEIVSDQMTAVWNNFDDGSKSLEYYADVMTALGAATASSTDEIAQGLEKFSAVAGTVGLSYEYATAALATVTAETRQSADVVGTAFKTLFARIEGLQLGETLEDGTDLNKYSQALATVGVQIKDASGEMRSMDDILSDLGARWQTLAKDEQIALAQTVAGVRQYNQLISLMDNWDVMQENLGTAYGSTGALQEQADIYAESWEAASNRARAAAEGIYSSLLDDKFFIKMTDSFANLLENINKFTDVLGGMPGVLSLIASVMTRAFGPQIAASITQFVDNFKIMTGQAEQTAAVMRDKTIIALQAFTKDLEITSASGIETQVMIDQVQHAYDLQEISERINGEHEQEIKELMQIEQQYGNIAATAARSAEEASTAQTKRLQSMRAELVDDAIKRGATAEQGRNLAQGVENNFKQFGTVQEMSMRLQEKPKTKTSTLVSELENSGVELYGPLGEAISKYTEIRDRATSTEEEAVQKQKDLQVAGKAVREEIKHFGTDTEYADEVIQTYAENFKEAHTNIKSSSKTLKEVGKGFVDQSKKVREGENALSNYQKRVKITENTLKKAGNKVASFGQKFTQGLQGVSSFAMGLTSLSAAIDTLNDPDLSTWEKFTSVLMSMSIGIGSLISGISSFTKTTGLATVAKTLFAAAVENANDKIYEELALQSAEQIVESNGVTLATATIMSQRAKAMAWLASKESLEELSEEEIKEQLIAKAGIAADTAEIIAKNLKSGATLKEAMAEAGLTTVKGTGIIARISATGATIAETLAQWGLNAAMAPFVGIMLAAVAAMLPYIAIAGVLALVVYGVVKAVNAEKEAIEDAEAAEKRAAENAKRVAEEINNISESLNNIDKNTRALEDLDKYSQEWYKTLTDINREVQEIIDIYPELLAMGMITRDLSTGALGITEEGKEYINQQNTQKLIEANNISLRAQQRTAKAKYDAAINKIGSYSYSDSQNFSGDQIEHIVAYYNSYGEELYADAALQKQLYKNMFNVTPSDEEFNKFTEGLKDYKEFIKENNEYLNEIVNYHNQILQNYAAAIGSNRSAEQLKDLLGSDYSTYSITGSGNSATLHYGNNKSFNMNKHVNYDEDDADWATVQEFMDMQGDNVEYVAQRHGKMVLKIDGTETEFSEQEIYDALGEAHALEKFEADLEAELTEELGSILGENIEALELNDLVNLDNLSLGIQAAFGEDEVKQADNAFKKIVDAYGSTKEELEELAADTAFVDYNDANFKRLVSDTSLTADQLQEKIKELNAIGNINASGEWFAQQAEQYGLDSAAAETMQGYALHLMQAADSSEYLSDNIDINADSAKALSVQIVRMNKGIEDLAEGFEEWSDILKNSDEISLEYYETLNKVQEALGNIFDINGSLISGSFIEAHLAELEKVAQGDVEAIESVRDALQEEVVTNIALGQTEQWKTDFYNAFDEVQSIIADKQLELDDLEVGAVYQDQGLLDALNDMITESQLTADQVNDILSTMNYTPVYNQEEIENGMEMPNGSTKMIVESVGLDGGELIDLGPLGSINLPTVTYRTESLPADPTPADAKMRLTSFSGGTTAPTIQGLVKKDTGANSNYSPKNAGGKTSSGGSKSSYKPKKTKITKKSEIVERYKEITDAIDDVSEAMDKASKKADKLYGSAKVKAMQEEIALSKQKVALLEKQIDEAETLLEIDKKSLDIAAQDLGLRFTYDGLGNITNYTQQLNELYNQLAEVERTMNSMSTQEAQDKYKESTYEPLQEKISALEAAMDQYEETRELIEDLRTEIDDEVQNQIDKEFEIFKYKIEVKLDVNDREMKILDLLLKRIDDDAFAAAQSMALLTSKTDEMLENFSIYEQGINDIYAKHGLTPEAAANMTAEQLEAVGFSETEIETLQEYNDGLIETTENLMDIKEQIEQSLIDLFDAWNDEINETIDKFNLLNDTLSAFQNIVDVLGYNRLGLSLDWQKDMIEAQNTVGLEQLESLVEKKEALEETAKTSQEHLEAAQKRLEKAQKTVKDENVLAELEADVKYWEEMVDKTQNELDQATVDVYTSLDEFVTQAVENYKRLTEAILEEWERSISAMGKTLEETMNMYDKAAELEERYVSNYEKAYSLSKLTSSIEKSLNDTTSLKHQQQLKDMLKEIQEIQESGKELSQYDLDYLQKKYDLTVAQMSLEDAYNAKTQVIRRRDSEGNWGYVYTANEEDKEAAMTTYRDKVYEMMELNENFIRDTESKLLEARQRMAEELAALADMALTEEEYNERATAIIEHYQELDSYYLGEIQKALDNNNTLYDSDALAFAEKAGFKLSTAIAFKNDYITITEEMAKTILSIEESTFKTREEYLQALAKATGLSVNTVTKLYEDGVIKALKLSEEQRDGIASIDEQNFKNKEDYLKEIAKITGLSIDEVTEMYKAGTLAAIAETEKLEGSVLGSNTVMTLSFGQTTLSVVTGYGTAAAAGAAFGAANTVLTAGLSANYASFAAVTETALGIAGMSSETFGAVSKRVMETSKEKANQYKESIRQLGEQMKTSFSEGANAVTGFQKQYSAKIGECVTITKALSEAITNLMKKLNKLDPKLDSSFGGGDSTNINNVSDAINAWKNGTISSASLGALIGAEIWMDPNSNWGNGQERKDKMKKLLGDNWENVWKAQVDYSNKYSYSGQTYSEWFDKWKQKLTPYSYNNMKSYDTGGYTGAWGPDGKLAMLHEKELVLNKQDTSNFLLALDVLERIISNVSANSLTFNPVQPINVGNLSGLQGLEQNITIHADFHDATSAKDIEEAFNLMINRASQYANIK